MRDINPALNVLAHALLLFYFVFVKHLGIKKPPDYGQEAIQMFLQRNNPYCK
jgi:hypothetical protein